LACLIGLVSIPVLRGIAAKPHHSWARRAMWNVVVFGAFHKASRLSSRSGWLL